MKDKYDQTPIPWKLMMCERGRTACLVQHTKCSPSALGEEMKCLNTATQWHRSLHIQPFTHQAPTTWARTELDTGDTAETSMALLGAHRHHMTEQTPLTAIQTWSRVMRTANGKSQDPAKPLWLGRVTFKKKSWRMSHFGLMKTQVWGTGSDPAQRSTLWGQWQE
jgi:hypothetical protein